MFTEEEMHALFGDVMERMLKAGWLVRFTYTLEKGWHLVWSEGGWDRAGHLLLIAKTFALLTDDRAPIAFDVICKAGGLDAGGFSLAPGPDIAGLWNQSIEALDLSGSEDGLLVLVHILEEWAEIPERPN